MSCRPVSADPILKYKALLAPMEGIMTPWFIKVCGKFDLVEHWITPFFSVTGGAVPSKRIIRKRLQPFLETGKTITAQILGKDPDNILKCAENMLETGLVSGINLNFSCPSPTVTGNGSGAAMLAYPDLMEKIIAEVRKNLPEKFPLSTKLRAGIVVPALEDAVKASVNGGADLIIFHYRTKEEMYIPVPDGWNRIRRAVETANKIPVYGNGDIKTPDDAEKMIRETGCRGIAAARAFFSDPLLISKINGFKASLPVDFPSEMKKENAPEPTIRAVCRFMQMK